ncbi:pentapeptide repeat-containing protein, partial [Phytoactinopolyspora endophytica]|uniref:pentapeptide repeat-containing protein n=1 Tax=Phytoactinopolyspora endophytica TaxID=1642495 RepID=UPI0013ED98AA
MRAWLKVASGRFRLRSRRIRRWLRDPNDDGGMWRLSLAITVTLCVAVVVAAALVTVAWQLLEPTGEATIGDFIDIVVVIFGVIAGGGGSVALVVAYRRQKVNERGELRETARLLSERFQAASEQLGHERSAVRLAGTYAMAHLADDWEEQRQMCVDVLCAYLRDAGKEPDERPSLAALQAWDSDREVRHTILRIIADHLRNRGLWTGCDFDLTGIAMDTKLSLDGVSFPAGSNFVARDVLFRAPLLLRNADFGGGEVSFAAADFGGGEVSFAAADFGGGEVSFAGAMFNGSEVSFANAKFSGTVVSFSGANFDGGSVSFTDARFDDGRVSFFNAESSGRCTVSFVGAQFGGCELYFFGARFDD